MAKKSKQFDLVGYLRMMDSYPLETQYEYRRHLVKLKHDYQFEICEASRALILDAAMPRSMYTREAQAAASEEDLHALLEFDMSYFASGRPIGYALLSGWWGPDMTMEYTNQYIIEVGDEDNGSKTVDMLMYGYGDVLFDANVAVLVVDVSDVRALMVDGTQLDLYAVQKATWCTKAMWEFFFRIALDLRSIICLGGPEPLAWERPRRKVKRVGLEPS